MGTKRTNWTIEDPLQRSPLPATHDRGYQSSEWISREARPQVGPSSQAKREREREARRAREMDRIWEKSRGGRREVETDQRDRERLSAFKQRAGDIERTERDRRREDSRHTNEQYASVQNLMTTEFREREREKGDTFPRTTRPSNEREKGKKHYSSNNTERGTDRAMWNPGGIDMSGRERDSERERAKRREIQRYRELERQREEKEREEMKRNGGRRAEKEESDRRRDRGWERRRERDIEVSDQQVMRERDVYRERGRPAPRPREDPPSCFHSVQRRRIMEGDKEHFSDREEMDERLRAGRKERHRYTKSEGDSDVEKEREVRRKEDSATWSEGVRPRERVREGERRREIERQRERDRRKEREMDILGSRGREGDRGIAYVERPREREQRKRDGLREQRGPDRQRDEVTQHRKRKKELDERQLNFRDKEREGAHAHSYSAEREMRRYPEWRRSWEDEDAGRSSQSLTETYRKMQTEAHGAECLSGSDVEEEPRRRGMTDSFGDQERASTSEGNEERKKKRSEEGQDVTRGQREREAREGSQKEDVETEREGEREKPERKQKPLKKMWLEPRSGRESSKPQQEEFRERERVREKYAQRYRDVETLNNEGELAANGRQEKVLPEDGCGNINIVADFRKEDDRENTEETSRDEDIDLVFESEEDVVAPWQTEVENVFKDLEGSDRESERGSDRYGNSEEGEGSEGGWEEEGKERMTSGEDGFVTVSSGGDEEAEEDKFEDCEEFWAGEVREDLTRQSLTKIHQWEGEIETRMTKERSDHTVTVFCVVGQPLPRSGSNQSPPMDHLEEEPNQHSALDCGGNREVDQAVEASRDIVTTEESDAMCIRENGAMEEITQTKRDCGHRPLSEEDISSKHDVENAEVKITKEIQSEDDLVVTGSVSADKNSESQQPECYDSSSQNREVSGGVEKSLQLEETQCKPEEKKRQSAAPHVKWAKNVLHEILGSSDDGDVNLVELSTQSGQTSNGVPTEVQAQGASGSPASPLYSVVQKPCKHVPRSTDQDSELMQARTDLGGGSVAQTYATMDTVVEKEILIVVERESEWEAERLEKEFLEGDTDDEAECDIFVSSADQQSLSSEGETEKGEYSKKCEKPKKKGVWEILSSSSFRDLGNEARIRRRGFRKTTEKQHEEDREGAGRDRRTRVFPSECESDELRSTWSEAELKNILSSGKGTINRTRMRNSKYYNSQLYQQYSEVVQNREILHQAHSDTSSVFGEIAATVGSSPTCLSPPLACRPLPPLPSVPYHSVSHPNSSSVSLASLPPIPQRPSSPRLAQSLTSSPMLWQDLPTVRNSPELSTLSPDERRLQEVRFEVVTSEASYCSSLDIVVEHFVKSKQLNTLLTTQDKNWLFSRLCDVRAISHSFFAQLEERVESDVLHFAVSDLIIKHCPRFRSVYVPYLTNQSYQDKTYQTLMHQNAAFRHVVEKLEHSPKCQRLPFRSFLILPFQRITRLKLLVQNIVKRTAPKTKAEAQAIKAMKLLEKMIQESNDSISQMKSIESLVSLNAKVDFECKTLPLISQSRRLVREGPVTELRDFSLKETERSVYLHLFNDYLLLSLHKEGGRFTVIDHAPVSELRAENCRVKLHSLKKNLFRLYIASKSLLLRTDTQADKLRWISALSCPHPEIDFTAAQDIPQMQCMRAFVAQQPDELSLEKADVLLVHQQSSDGWVEGTRLSDRHRGWVPEAHLETIVSEKARQCNLMDILKIATATATV